ncbi:MAG TPA: FAD-dependent oxidoreductase [Candidatus Dormibacteraeota bacterium]|nr:FAD-dependent oxidoreductase [Candidatus Dormibacteraeota bacterium]
MRSEGVEVVVVGGGAAGCVLARRLAERGRPVLLLEAGPDLGRGVGPALLDGWRNPRGSEWTTDWGYESEPNADGNPTTLRRGKLLGGTSWLTRFAVRGHPADFDAWAARGNPGWSFSEVLPAFRRLETDADFGGDPWHGNAGPMTINRYGTRRRSAIHDAAVEALRDVGFASVEDHNAPGAVGAGPMPMSTRDGRRLTTLQAYVQREGSPASLRINAGTEVDNVLLERGRVRGVRLIDGTEIAADLVILSAGTYGSPPLLMRSGLGPASHLRDLGIAVVVDLPGVGANLADHPAVDLDAGFGGDAACEVLRHTIATYRSRSQPTDGPPDLMFWIHEPSEDDGRLYLDPILLKPESRGTVRLRSADPQDPPRIVLPGVRTDHDVVRLMEGYEVGVAIANHRSIRALAGESGPSMPSGTAELRERVANAYSLPHVVGTCRMGPSPDAGDVVDAIGRVHGVDGLRVIDASVIPDAPSGFPHLVTIMAAEHLSQQV